MQMWRIWRHISGYTLQLTFQSVKLEISFFYFNKDIYDASKVQYNWESLTLYDLHHPEFDIRSVTKSKRNEIFFIGT